MQFVLVDTWVKACRTISESSNSNPVVHSLGVFGGSHHASQLSTTTSTEYLRFEVSTETLSSEKNRYKDFNDEEQNKIASEILTDMGPKPLTVLIPIEDEDERWSVVSGSILKKLSVRFPDEPVEISVHLTTKLYDQSLDIASLKGQKINFSNYICTGSVNPATLKGVQTSEIKNIHLQLVVKIPDKPVKPIPEVDQLIENPAPRKVLEEALFSDLTISVGNEAAEFKSHKCFLSACSPVLRRMFEDDPKEGKLEIEDISEQGVRAFLRYLYYGDLKEPKADIQVTFELLSLARKYEVRNLETEMIKCLMDKPCEGFTAELAFKIYLLIKDIDSAVILKRGIIRFMKSHMEELESLQEYKNLFEKPSNSKTAMELCKDFVKDDIPY